MQQHNEVAVRGIHHRYIGRGRVRLMLETEVGEDSYIMSTKMLARSINSAIACMRNNESPVFRDVLCAQD
jgi:hypothetical protein